jgi:hypothetical protein
LTLLSGGRPLSYERSRTLPDRCGRPITGATLVDGLGHPTDATNPPARNAPPKHARGGAPMTKQLKAPRTELANRSSDGLDVTLL